jgi:hypothetical protein
MSSKKLPIEFSVFEKRLASTPRSELEALISSLWLRFNVEEFGDDEYRFNPDKEVGGADLVEWVGDQLSEG